MSNSIDGSTIKRKHQQLLCQKYTLSSVIIKSFKSWYICPLFSIFKTRRILVNLIVSLLPVTSYKLALAKLFLKIHITVLFSIGYLLVRKPRPQN